MTHTWTPHQETALRMTKSSVARFRCFFCVQRQPRSLKTSEAMFWWGKRTLKSASQKQNRIVTETQKQNATALFSTTMFSRDTVKRDKTLKHSAQKRGGTSAPFRRVRDEDKSPLRCRTSAVNDSKKQRNSYEACKSRTPKRAIRGGRYMSRQNSWVEWNPNGTAGGKKARFRALAGSISVLIIATVVSRW